MKASDHPRVKELLETNRMVYPSPREGSAEYRQEGNYIRGLVDFVDEIIGQDFVMCEIGSYMGVSSEVFSLFVKKLYCVDIWDFRPKESHVEPFFDEMLSKYDNIIKIKKDSVEASKDFEDGVFDIIYIDGDHSEDGFRNDMNSWVSKVKDSGIVSGHDYGMISNWLQDYVNLDNVKVFKDFSWAYFKTNHNNG